jgi:predicted ATP-grasp superfamily ATP-dependent carboligase
MPEQRNAAAPPPMLVAAITGRALAASAARGGHPVVVLDCFADLDTRALAGLCRSVVSPRALRFDRRALLAAAAALASPAHSAGLVIGSGFEARPGLLAALARGRRLFGNGPAAVAAVKDPRQFFPLLDRLGIPHPDVSHAPPPEPQGWLVKQAGGAGGAQVRHADRRRAPHGAYFQRLTPGRACSAIFLADGRRACLLGLNEQWASPARPGLPFLYGGAVGRTTLPPIVESSLRASLDALVAATGLVGLNGLDFLLADESWSVLEVNPRPTATMELYDPDYERGLFDAHLRACDGMLPSGPAPARAARAHTVIHATRTWRAGESFVFPHWCRDLPEAGTTFAQGDPVCTAHAEGPGPAEATALMRQRQAAIERMILEAAADAVGA